jgi:hypothetical protein
MFDGLISKINNSIVAQKEITTYWWNKLILSKAYGNNQNPLIK